MLQGIEVLKDCVVKVQTTLLRAPDLNLLLEALDRGLRHGRQMPAEQFRVGEA